MQYQSGETIINQYRIVDILGQGLGGTTYKAIDLKSEDYVALKVLSFQEIKNWKMMDLFEREAFILAQLEHPAIPEYLNYFQQDNSQEQCWYLVQKFIDGQSLATLIENGWRTTEAEIINIATQILEILTYLHSLNPPVIHRDIKPQNIIRQSDGKIYLVDFGAVTDIYRQTLIGSSTIVGTYGYMPPEQFRGQVVPATDLYALGATLLYLLTYSSPAEFPQKRLKIDFRSSINVSQHFSDWLEIILEPAVEDRFESATQALAVLKG
ncbi:MAG: serine/threonine-protein kinase, partial [Cyanobacteria bacterium P01_A01_bin.40]